MIEYTDPLYGQLPISPAEAELFHSQALARLRDISLSAVPNVMLPWGKIASRFEHSVGVAHLAKIVGRKPAFRALQKDLVFAALLHDVGSPPFSHLSEPFLRHLTGKSHEEYVSQVLKTGTTFSVIRSFGGKPKVVLDLIRGDYLPFGRLIAGTIDLDNLDYTLRWGMGAGHISRLYEPERLASAFEFDGKELTLDARLARDIDGWEFCREQIYDIVYEDENLAPAAMLMRAIGFAFEKGDLDERFFLLTDHQALYILEQQCNQLTRGLTQAARLWRFYQRAAQLVTETPSSAFRQLVGAPLGHQRLADQLASELGIPREQICVVLDKDKGYKQIDLPVRGERTVHHQPRRKLRYLLKVYVHPEVLKRAELIRKKIQIKLSLKKPFSHLTDLTGIL